MGIDTGKGWFQAPGLRPAGDRTVEEQMIGMDPALAEAAGKTVLDLGCAEGFIGLAFAKAGAVDVLGVEALQSHLDVAYKVCKDAKQMRFVCADLRTYGLGEPAETFDIVLALGIIHKMQSPAKLLRWAARSCKDLLLFRGPGAERLKGWDGVIYPKRHGEPCNVPVEMTKSGFVLERQIDGVRGEGVHYWRRKK